MILRKTQSPENKSVYLLRKKDKMDSSILRLTWSLAQRQEPTIENKILLFVENWAKKFDEWQKKSGTKYGSL